MEIQPGISIYIKSENFNIWLFSTLWELIGMKDLLLISECCWKRSVLQFKEVGVLPQWDFINNIVQ